MGLQYKKNCVPTVVYLVNTEYGTEPFVRKSNPHLAGF